MRDSNFTVNEPIADWGGPWTVRKLNAFSKYVSAYLTIMEKYPYWKTIYFDGFAGNGNRNEHCNTPLYKQLNLNLEEELIYRGAAERILSLHNLSFDFHYFIDLKKQNLDKLEEKLLKHQAGRKYPFQYRDGDANERLRELSGALKDKSKKLAALVLLDPFGMQINWESIALLKETRSDIWILLPTGVVVNRLLNRNGEIRNQKKLESFFGLNETEIKNHFYRTEIKSTLFGETEIVEKIKNPIEQIAFLYAKQLKTIWKYVTEKPLALYNSKNVPIFHFVFASNNQSALKIASQIIDKS